METAMNNLNVKLIIFSFCLLFIVSDSAGTANNSLFSGTLSCSRIGPRHPDNTAASGKIFFQLDESGQELTYNLEVEKINNAYMAHVHIWPTSKQSPTKEDREKQGPIAAWLYPVGDHKAPDRCIDGEFTGIIANEVITPEDLQNDISFAELVEAMRNGNAYADVHTKKYITCEISGQIKPHP